jgi:hypothetical protein
MTINCPEFIDNSTDLELQTSDPGVYVDGVGWIGQYNSYLGEDYYRCNVRAFWQEVTISERFSVKHGEHDATSDHAPDSDECTAMGGCGGGGDRLCDASAQAAPRRTCSDRAECGASVADEPVHTTGTNWGRTSTPSCLPQPRECSTFDTLDTFGLLTLPM